VTPTTTQRDALARLAASPSGRLGRLSGGFWTIPGTPTHPMATGGGRAPDWSVTIQTVRAMEQRGWLVRAPEEWRDERVLTEAGRAAASE